MPPSTAAEEEHLVAVGGVELCVATFGDPNHPTVLLPSTAKLFWENQFCQRLAGAGRHVVRYDLRDTGWSTACPAGSPDYGLADLADDLVGLLDVLGLPHAHVVGFSVAGWVCQLAALDRPRRVSALTLINTRPTAPGPADTDLPEHLPRVMEFFTRTPQPEWSDRAAVIDHCVREAHVLAGTRGFDAAQARSRVVRIVDRTADMAASAGNLAFADPGERWRERLRDLAVPTVVLHGTDDPFFPFGNGQALAREIPGAELIPLEGIGHELPQSCWDPVLTALLAQPVRP